VEQEVKLNCHEESGPYGVYTDFVYEENIDD
jgi:hypothetical protein